MTRKEKWTALGIFVAGAVFIMFGLSPSDGIKPTLSGLLWGVAILGGIAAVLWSVEKTCQAAAALARRLRASPVGNRIWNIGTSVVGAALLCWVVYSTWLNPAPHDLQSWTARRNKLAARLAAERAHAAETVEAKVRDGRDLETARYLVAMDMRRLEQELANARDSALSYHPDLGINWARLRQAPRVR